ncbi:hypothetical protein [Streptomyces sp. NBRC 109706]|uniref:hypothetical protein n=1 Tax=Streptomyces sp. NBRC 109706 TaxID=1550035 RepID=UPI0007837108|nr:hypothetical protein [Streptomyces sp. NBRC 109706]
MTRDEALRRLGDLVWERAFGWDVGSDRLIRAGLDALLAGVECPSLARLAGLLRREEPEAPQLFDAVVDELGLGVRLPSDPPAVRWALARWLARRIVDGSIDPDRGTRLIWSDAAFWLRYPEELEPFVRIAIKLADTDPDTDTDTDEAGTAAGGGPLEELRGQAVLAARRFLGEERSDGPCAGPPETVI